MPDMAGCHEFAGVTRNTGGFVQGLGLTRGLWVGLYYHRENSELALLYTTVVRTAPVLR